MNNQDFDEIAQLIDRRAPAITMTELAERRASGPAGNVAPLRARRPRRGVTIAVSAASAAAVVAAITIAVAAQPGGGSARPGPVTGPVRYARLTAAMVRRVVQASSVALAPSGHLVVRYADIDGGIPDGSGTLDITFAGPDFNSVSAQPGSKPFIYRVVDGQEYTFGDPPPGQPLQWYHSTSETSGGQKAPDPVKLLGALRPAAGFEVIGRQVIDGVPVEHLRATNVTGLSAQLLSLQTADQPISGLDVYVDSKGVIQQLDLRCKGLSEPGGLPETNTISVRFLDIGKPETIKAPAHFAEMVTHG